jgi:hypothetical protein
MPSQISDARLAANRANAASSTGPRTPEGKDASKYNRLRHGLASPLAVLAFEDQGEYNNLYSSFLEEYSPIGATEQAFVKTIADAQWKLRRLEKLEECVFAAMLESSQNEPTTDPFQAMAASLLSGGKHQSALGLLARYQATLNRQFVTGVRELKRCQRERLNEDYDAAKRQLAHNVLDPEGKRTPEQRSLIDLLAVDPDFFTRYLNAETELLSAARRCPDAVDVRENDRAA